MSITARLEKNNQDRLHEDILVMSSHAAMRRFLIGRGFKLLDGGLVFTNKDDTQVVRIYEAGSFIRARVYESTGHINAHGISNNRVEGKALSVSLYASGGSTR